MVDLRLTEPTSRLPTRDITVTTEGVDSVHGGCRDGLMSSRPKSATQRNPPIVSTFFRRLLAVAFAGSILLGAAGCSDDDSANASATPEPAGSASEDSEATPGGGAGDNGDTDDIEFDLDEITGGSDRPFGLDREGLAQSMLAGTKADRWEVDGNTIRLIFSEGSVDSVSPVINCTATNSLKADEDRVVLVYPDGEVDCDEQS